MTSINLIPAYRRAARKRQTRLRGWVVGGCVYVGLLLAAVFACHGIWGQTDRALADEVAGLEKDIQQTRSQIAAMKPDLTEAHLQWQASRAVAVQPDWSVLLALLGEIRGENVVLERCKLTPDKDNFTKARKLTQGKFGAGTKPEPEGTNDESKPSRKPMNFTLEIGGLGREQVDVSQFVLKLEQSGLFETVKLLETARYPFGDGQAVSFRIQCAIGEPDTEAGS